MHEGPERTRWLLGALLTEASAICYTLGAAYLRYAVLDAADALADADFSPRQRARYISSPETKPFSGTSDEFMEDASLSDAGWRRFWAMKGWPPPLVKIMCRLSFWAGLGLRLVACTLWWQARGYAGDATVAPLFLAVVLISNLAGGPSLLFEQYHFREVVMVFVCLFFLFAGSQIDLGLIDARKLSIREMDVALVQETRLHVTLMVGPLWLLAVVVCLVALVRGRSNQAGSWPGHFSVHGHAAARFAWPIPVLSGLFTGAAYGVGEVVLQPLPFVLPAYLTGVEISRVEDVMFLVGLCVFNLCQVRLTVEGARRFDCRYFLPTATSVGFFTATVLRVFFVSYATQDYAETSQIAKFLCVHAVLVLGPLLFLSASPARIRLPRTLKRGSPVPTPPSPELSPYRDGTVDPLTLGVATPFLEWTSEQHGSTSTRSAPDPEPSARSLRLKRPKDKTSSWLFERWVAVGCALPMILLISCPIFFLYVCIWGRGMLLDWLGGLAIFTLVSVGGTSLRIVVFSSVGRFRLGLCMNTNYLELLRNGRKRPASSKKAIAKGGGRLVVVGDPYDTPGSSSSEDDEQLWRLVRHFVVVENDWVPDQMDELRALLESIAASPLAVAQIAVLIIANEGDTDQQEVVIALEREFGRDLRWLGVICAPVQQSAARSRQILHTLVSFAQRAQDFHMRSVLVTFTTADAVFHEEYFTALTFAFVSSGSKRGSIIWQPPVLHLGDYHTQTGIIRHAALFLSQSQLATLSDPMAVPLPKSTWSLPLLLLRKTDGCWEPDFPLPLQNSGIWTKCWFTTIGRHSVRPIFLPVIRRAMRGDSLMPEAQVQLFARGLLELVYCWGALPLALIGRRSRGGGERTVGVARLLCLALRSMPPMLGIAWGHVVFTWWIAAMCLNGMALFYCYMDGPDKWMKSWQMLVAATALLVGLGMLPTLLVAHAMLLRRLDIMVSATAGGSLRAPGRPTWHVLRLAVQGIYAGPAFLVGIAVAEWRLAARMLVARLGTDIAEQDIKEEKTVTDWEKQINSQSLLYGPS